MRKINLLRIAPLVLACFALLAPQARAAQANEPIVYTVKFPEPAKQYALVEAVVPTGKQAAVEMMMPIWTPGYYKVENYAANIQELKARTPDGKALKVDQPKKNRWTIQTDGGKAVVLTYKVSAKRSFVTSNYVGDDMAVLNGGPSFITLVEKAKRPHDIHLELSPKWKESMTGLDPAPDGKPHHYRASDFDTLVDSPIMAGNLAITDFTVEGSKHYVVAGGNTAQWDGKRAAADFEKLVKENHRMWGGLPFKRYVYLFSLKGGGGGLEHSNSALMMSDAASTRGPGPNLRFLRFVSHEYFHAFNVKRLRPVELGPFDYEKEPRTTGLWVSEGLTNYYGDLVVSRAGFGTFADCLSAMSGHINSLQNSPGRLVQTLDKSSYDVWQGGGSGVGKSDKTISYYTKGPVVGWLLDAKIQKATNGKKSLDDVMKIAMQRYGGEKGFTADQFRETAEEVAGGMDMKASFKKWLATTDELDYTEPLDWFGLRFAPGEGAKKTWRLEVRPDATEAQRNHLQAWLRRDVK
ncbi:MAG TPA: hypothetical protein VE988_05845 [Gemmataceae bacterium]|nr:hypothetical protein [Gemmataceae bacterium]